MVRVTGYDGKGAVLKFPSRAIFMDSFMDVRDLTQLEANKTRPPTYRAPSHGVTVFLDDSYPGPKPSSSIYSPILLRCTALIPYVCFDTIDIGLVIEAAECALGTRGLEFDKCHRDFQRWRSALSS